MVIACDQDGCLSAVGENGRGHSELHGLKMTTDMICAQQMNRNAHFMRMPMAQSQNTNDHAASGTSVEVSFAQVQHMVILITATATPSRGHLRTRQLTMYMPILTNNIPIQQQFYRKPALPTTIQNDLLYSML